MRLSLTPAFIKTSTDLFALVLHMYAYCHYSLFHSAAWAVITYNVFVHGSLKNWYNNIIRKALHFTRRQSIERLCTNIPYLQDIELHAQPFMEPAYRGNMRIINHNNYDSVCIIMMYDTHSSQLYIHQHTQMPTHPMYYMSQQTWRLAECLLSGNHTASVKLCWSSHQEDSHMRLVD